MHKTSQIVLFINPVFKGAVSSDPFQHWERKQQTGIKFRLKIVMSTSHTFSSVTIRFLNKIFRFP